MLTSPISSRKTVPWWAISKRPSLAADGAGEGALLVAEELALEQLAREAGAIEVDEGLGGARSVGVQPVGQQSLADAGLAQDQHRDRRVHDVACPFGQGADGRALAHEGVHGRARLPRPLGQRELPVAAILDARCMISSSAGSSTGLVTKSSAPSRMACTARSIEPCPVRTMIGVPESMARRVRSKSRPSPSGSM